MGSWSSTGASNTFPQRERQRRAVNICFGVQTSGNRDTKSVDMFV